MEDIFIAIYLISWIISFIGLKEANDEDTYNYETNASKALVILLPMIPFVNTAIAMIYTAHRIDK